MEIRKYQAEDLEEIVQLFYETIQTVNRKDYSQEQVEVWSNRCENLRKNKTVFDWGDIFYQGNRTNFRFNCPSLGVPPRAGSTQN